ncbi:NAD(P)/FAD-dependent oxidoreductase [Mesorhizobium atlanticum]
MLLARAGLKVLAIDRKPYGTDTLSTHALMRPAVLQLWRWGLLEPLLKAGDTARRDDDLPLWRGGNHHPARRQLGPPRPDRAASHRARPHPCRRGAQGRRGGPARSRGRQLFADTRGACAASKSVPPAEHRCGVSADIVVGADGVGSLVGKMRRRPALAARRGVGRPYLWLRAGRAGRRLSLVFPRRDRRLVHPDQ